MYWSGENYEFHFFNLQSHFERGVPHEYKIVKVNWPIFAVCKSFFFWKGVTVLILPTWISPSIHLSPTNLNRFPVSAIKPRSKIAWQLSCQVQSRLFLSGKLSRKRLKLNNGLGLMVIFPIVCSTTKSFTGRCITSRQIFSVNDWVFFSLKTYTIWYTLYDTHCYLKGRNTR